MTWTAYRTTSKFQNGRLTKRMLSETAMLFHYDIKVPQNAVLLLKSLNLQGCTHHIRSIGTMVNTALKHYTGVSSDLTSERV